MNSIPPPIQFGAAKVVFNRQSINKIDPDAGETPSGSEAFLDLLKLVENDDTFQKLVADVPDGTVEIGASRNRMSSGDVLKVGVGDPDSEQYDDHFNIRSEYLNTEADRIVQKNNFIALLKGYMGRNGLLKED